MLSSFFAGMGIGASLIIAIGAQNAFVLVQGIRRNHHLLVAGICALVDALLISAGVLGIGAIVASSPVLRLIAGVGGVLFLFVFGLKSFLSVRKQETLSANGGPNSASGRQGDDRTANLKRTVLATLAVSLLNPHVYLDTVIMLGAISGNHAGDARYAFGLGAMSASFIWFFTLSWCGGLLAPVFAKPRAWQVLSVIVGLTVWAIAFGLAREVWLQVRAW